MISKQAEWAIKILISNNMGKKYNSKFFPSKKYRCRTWITLKKTKSNNMDIYFIEAECGQKFNIKYWIYSNLESRAFKKRDIFGKNLGLYNFWNSKIEKYGAAKKSINSNHWNTCYWIKKTYKKYLKWLNKNKKIDWIQMIKIVRNSPEFISAGGERTPENVIVLEKQIFDELAKNNYISIHNDGLNEWNEINSTLLNYFDKENLNKKWVITSILISIVVAILIWLLPKLPWN